jgi:tetratricopeptide (TPR) repeat protein
MEGSRLVWISRLTIAGLLLLSLGALRHALLVNWVSLEINRTLINGAPLAPSLADLAERDDEQSLRLSVIARCLQGDLAATEGLLRRYAAIASPQQISGMSSWIAAQSLRLTNCGDEALADQTMRLLFVFDDDAMAYARIGQLYQSLGRMNWAEQLLAQSLVLRPDAGTFLQLGALYAEQGIPLMETDYPEAMRLLTLASQAFESAVRFDPTVSVYANYRLGDIYWKLNRRLDAVQAYRQAAEGGGTGHYAFLSWYYLGQIYSAWWKEGLNHDLARSYFERALSVAMTETEEAICLTGIGKTYEARGRRGEALAAYRRALKNDPAYEPAQRALNELENGQ